MVVERTIEYDLTLQYLEIDVDTKVEGFDYLHEEEARRISALADVETGRFTTPPDLIGKLKYHDGENILGGRVISVGYYNRTYNLKEDTDEDKTSEAFDISESFSFKDFVAMGKQDVIIVTSRNTYQAKKTDNATINLKRTTSSS